MQHKKIFGALVLLFIAGAYSAQLMSVPKGTAQSGTAISQWPVYTDTIEVKVGHDEPYGSAYVVDLLPKKDMGRYKLPVVIGSCEMRGIEDAKFGSESPRPMTYDLFSKILAGTGCKINGVVVSKLQDGVYYADLLIDDNGNHLMFDARPSDAINLAMRSGAPIYVAKKVWEEAKEPTE